MSDFENLTISEQAQYIWDRCKYVANRTYSNQMINLYCDGLTYYEIWLFNNQIIKIERLSDKKILERYMMKLN
jgi:hypothetical protein